MRPCLVRGLPALMLVLCALAVSPARAQGLVTQPFQGTLGASAQQVMPAPFSAFLRQVPRHWAVFNVSPVSGGVTVACSFTTNNPAANTGGAFMLAPGAFREFDGRDNMPGAALYCSGSGAQITTELW